MLYTLYSNSPFLPPQDLGKNHSNLCYYESDYFAYLLYAESFSICTFCDWLISLSTCPQGQP